MVVPIGIKFPLTHATLDLAPGQSGTVFDLPVPKGWVAFIESFGNAHYRDSYYDWRVDGKSVAGEIDYTIGNINSPKIFDPPIIAHKSITVRAVNKSNSTNTYAVIMDGSMFPDKPSLTADEQAISVAMGKLTPQELELLKKTLAHQ